MKKSLKRLTIVALILTMALGIFALSGCESFDLAKYKTDAKGEIDTYAATKVEANYMPENWTALCNAVIVGKASVDAAESKPAVDTAVLTAKEEINEVEFIKELILPMSGAEEYIEGNGTEATPYIIYNRGQLIHFSNQINEGLNKTASFALGADIDFDGMEWTPIGIFEHYYGNDVFNGVFDGNGYEISNFRITVRHQNTSAKNIGLFGCNGGIIKNLGVVDVNIDIAWSYKSGFNLSISAGGLAGSNIGSITNCYTIGNINLEYSGGATIATPAHIRAGGLVGYSTGNLTNCYSAVDVNAVYNNEAGTVYAAGLVVGGTVENCFVTGTVNAEYSYHTIGGESKVFSVGGELVNCYAYEGQIVAALNDILCSADELNTADFYANRLGWNTDVWAFESLSFIDGKFVDNKYPKLY